MLKVRLYLIVDGCKDLSYMCSRYTSRPAGRLNVINILFMWGSVATLWMRSGEIIVTERIFSKLVFGQGPNPLMDGRRSFAGFFVDDLFRYLTYNVVPGHIHMFQRGCTCCQGMKREKIFRYWAWLTCLTSTTVTLTWSDLVTWRMIVCMSCGCCRGSALPSGGDRLQRMAGSLITLYIVSSKNKRGRHTCK